MEACLVSDESAVVGECDAARGEDGIEVLEGVEVAVGDRLVEVDPECLGRLQLRGIWREVDETDAFGHGEWRGMPTGAVENEDDDAVPAGAGLAGEEFQGVLEQFLVDAGPEIPEAFTGGRRDEGGDIEPLEPVVATGDGALAARCPDPSQDRLQPDPVLVGGENLDDRAGVALGFFRNGVGKLFLNPACSSGVAARMCCGRGRWTLQPMARNASQPRCSATERPSSAAMKAAAFFAVHTPPSSGGCFNRARSLSRSAGVSTDGGAPLPRRRSPRLDGPKAL
jgi:hypothetical protein